jgi:hypothetical protein
MAAEEEAIADLEHKLRSLESLRSELGDALFNRKRAGLETRLRDLREALAVQRAAAQEDGGTPSAAATADTAGGGRRPARISTGASASRPRRSRRRPAPGPHVAGDVDTGGGDFVGRNQYNKFVYAGQPPRELLTAYYRCVAQECGRLPLGVVDPRFVPAGGETELSLASVYTDLDVVAVPRAQGEAAERWGLRLAQGGRRRAHAAPHRGRGRPFLAPHGDR